MAIWQTCREAEKLVGNNSKTFQLSLSSVSAKKKELEKKLFFSPNNEKGLLPPRDVSSQTIM